jgi:hypothetical protein
MLATPRPTNRCYTATYPERQWREVTCKTPPNKPYLPRAAGMTQLETVGGSGPDFAMVGGGGQINQADGSFDSVTGVTATPAYSLQLNTDFFPTSTCNGSPNAGCRGWEQFVYESAGTGFIQYWLIQYGPAGTMCPMPRGANCVAGGVSNDGWCPFTLGTSADPLYCVVNAAAGVPAPARPATSLTTGDGVNGAAAGVSGAANDAITVTLGGAAFSAGGNNYFPDLGNQWKEAEFNVFGNGGGSQAVFNSGASAVVRIHDLSGTNLRPRCDQRTFTGESSNLTLQNSPPTVVDGSAPALVFGEINPAPTGGPADCTDAVSLGDTHLNTFNGLHYDFQASGDFLLAEAGPTEAPPTEAGPNVVAQVPPTFVVQTRQASGAPTWPNASVNKAVATQMGETTVAICLAPTRLLIDGEPFTLDDQQSVFLPDDIILSRAGDLYIIQRENGDSVRARLNQGAQPIFDWIDVTVYFGDRSPNVSGLLGNPDGDPNLLGLSDGTVLSEPVTFNTLYHRYGDSWRVPSSESLLCNDEGIEVGNPSKNFYANNLTAAQQSSAQAICTEAGVDQPAALADCILDVTVLGTPGAAPGHARAPIPAVVWQAHENGR